MTLFLNLVLSGIVTGAIYSVMASGLVLTYSTSGIFNFAHGAIAFATAYVYYQLHSGAGLPIVPSLLVSVVLFAPGLGLLLDAILLRRLAKAPIYARVVGTIGLLVVLPNLVQWLVIDVMVKVLHWDLPGNEHVREGIPVPGIGPSPASSFQPLDGVAINSDQLAVLVVSAASALLLWVVLRWTRLGLEMRAVVDRDVLAGLRGVNAARTSAIAWVMTMLLAGLGGVLIAPLFTLTDYVFTLVVLGSLAVVVLAGMRSMPIAFVGGLVLGVVQNLVAGYADRFLPDVLSDLSGLKASVPFVLVVVLLLVFGRDRSRRGGSMAEEVPRPDHRHGMSAWRRRLPWAIATVLLLAYSLQWFDTHWFRADTYGQTVIANGLVVAVIFLSFIVVTGMGGMVSLAQSMFVTIAGFAAGWALGHDWGIDIPGIASDGQLNFLWALAIGAAVAGGVGMLLALPMSRLGGVSLALGTLACSFIFTLVVAPIESIGHSESGWPIRPPSLTVPGVGHVVDLLVPGDRTGLDLSQLPDQIVVFLGVFGILTGMLHLFQRSATGRAMLAVRSSEVAAEASGIRANRTKVLVFGLSAAIAGVGGVLLGIFGFSVGQTTAPPMVGLAWLAIVVTFGIRRPGGALLAGLAYTCGTALFHLLGDALPGGTVNDLVTSGHFVPILSGIGAIQLAQEPDGLLALAGHHRAAKRRAREAARTRAPGPPAPPRPVVLDEGALVDLRGIVAGYGDAEVLHGVDLALRPGTVTALLGANGAGKSTLCAVAAGVLTPAAGSVHIVGQDVTSTPSYERARRGVVFVPEARGVFPGLSVEDNLALVLRTEQERELAYARFPVLGERRRQPAGLLSGGEQQMLSLVPALVAPPAVLIADEPTLGLAPLVAEIVMEAIVEIRGRGAAVLLVEEHARNAFEVADRVAYLELGRISWSGATADADLDLLRSAYLGRAVDADLPAG